MNREAVKHGLIGASLMLVTLTSVAAVIAIWVFSLDEKPGDDRH